MFRVLAYKAKQLLGTARSGQNQMFERIYGWEPVLTLPGGYGPDAIGAAAEILKSVPPFPPFDAPIVGPHPVSQVSLASFAPADTPQHALLYIVAAQSLLAVKRAVSGVRLGTGVFRHSLNSSIQFGLWLNYGNARLWVLPNFELIGQTLHVQVMHVILCRQEWMDDHIDDEHDILDLSQRYRTHFSSSGSYNGISTLFAQGGHYFCRGPAGGYSCSAYGTQPIAFSTTFRSFVHFKVGDKHFESGSHMGAAYSNILESLTGVATQWQNRLSLPSGVSPALLAGEVRTKPRLAGRVLEQQD